MRKPMVVYSAIFSNKDMIHDNQPKVKGVDYIMFTDDLSLSSKTWKVRHVARVVPECGARCSRYYKLLPHRHFSKYRYSLWIDANTTLKFNPLKAAKKVLPPGKSIAMVFQSNGRDCCYDEAEFCIKINKDDPQRLREQIRVYKEWGMPEHFGLWGGKLVYRLHNHYSSIVIGEMWWQHFLRYSKRDQVSFPFVLWANPEMATFFNEIKGKDVREYTARIISHKHIWKRPDDKGSML